MVEVALAVVNNAAAAAAVSLARPPGRDAGVLEHGLTLRSRGGKAAGAMCEVGAARAGESLGGGGGKRRTQWVVTERRMRAHMR